MTLIVMMVPPFDDLVTLLVGLEPEKKIRDIKIKDIAADVTSIDELSSVAKTLKLEAPQNGVRRSGSTQSLNCE